MADVAHPPGPAPMTMQSYSSLKEGDIMLFIACGGGDD